MIKNTYQVSQQMDGVNSDINSDCNEEEKENLRPFGKRYSQMSMRSGVLRDT